ncbi:hypothetical protein FE257_000233 [Aspergillus nanangensis]|uniref:Major facilitator superfamily (MFS) profile domain-containing protein n=1 Tax=Aspergillus nanangensis TaxID=2582783 RepID=A0AAD4CZ41_ASPNN|nr:hypothetical protein FE257_000233 [Aspergillus nanangensis]
MASPPLSSASSSALSHLPTAEPENFESIRSPGISRRQTNVDLARIESLRLTHLSTVGSTAGPAPREKWLPFGGGKDYPPFPPDQEKYVVELICSLILAYVTFTSSFASAIFSSTIGHVSAQYGISTEVSILGVTLYVLGFASGPTVWAPASELIGRRWPITVGVFGYSLFTIATATAKDVQTIMLTRFFAGVFAAAPVAIVPAAYADMYNNSTRGVAIAMFAMAVFVGPFASPFVGGFITQSFLGWRWTMYISSFMGFAGTVLLVFFYKETYPPVLLMEKAATLRRQTHNWGIHAKQDEVELDFNEIVNVNFSRPFRMLFTEPIVFLITLYMSFIYGLMYALLAAYPVVFQQLHGMNLGVGGLPFIGLIVGEFLGGVFILLTQASYTKKLVANNDIPIPEWRLPPAIVGGCAFTIGLFWFGWTGWTKDIHWMAPTASGTFVGFGIYVIFLQCFNYLIDSYLQFAASVFAANTILRSAIGACFPLFSRQMERKNTFFFTEIRAGLATFFAMAYIISVNANITSESGGTCVCPEDSWADKCDSNQEYLLCVQEIKRDLVTATAAIAALGTFFLGLLANLPVALAPGMGLNAYFAFTVVGYHGFGMIPYRVALTAVFVEGFVFLGLTILGIRQWLARALPASIKLATGTGIGLYLTLIGLTYSAGIGLITGAQDSPVELAGCHDSLRDAKTGLCPASDKMRNPTMWIGIFCGGFLTAFLMLYRVKGAVIMGILLVSIISWPRPTPVTYFPHTELGDSMFDFFKRVVTFHPIKHTLVAQDWDISSHGAQFGLAFITFLYVDILDTTGTLYSMARFAGTIDERTQDFEGSALAYTVDAITVSIGSLFGSPPVTAFVESGAGISEGGRTGLTSCVTGLCFFIAVFFAPIFASIPPWATGCTLVIVGALMCKAAAEINWKYYGDAIPAFLTIAIMPFTYSIAYGLIAGILSYITINVGVWLIEKASGGRIVPPNKHAEKDPWTWRIPGGLLPPWLKRLFKGNKHFWRDDGSDVDLGVMPEGSLSSSGHDQVAEKEQVHPPAKTTSD